VARIDDQNLENSYFLMPAEKRPLFDVFPDQDHIQHMKKIDLFISSFLDQGEALEIPLEGNDPEDKASGEKTEQTGDPGIMRLVMTMSKEQKQELIANLLRHRSMHVAYMYGQLNNAMDQHGNPTGQGGTGEMATEPNDEEGLAEIANLMHAVPELANVQF
jgi:hypothetical protein